MIFYVLAEAVTIAAILWAAWGNWRYFRIAHNLESKFGTVYSFMLLSTCLWWLSGAALRFEWAVKGSWNGLWDIWTIKWLGWWFIAAVGNGLRTDMEIQTSKWEHWRDIMRAQPLLTARGVKALLFLGVMAFIAAILITVARGFASP